MPQDDTITGRAGVGHADNRLDGPDSALSGATALGHAFYRHFKGRYYQVVGEALDTATEGRVVVYRTLYPSGHVLFTRPYDEFHGWKDSADGQRVRRFTPVRHADLPADARIHVIGVLPLPTE